MNTLTNEVDPPEQARNLPYQNEDGVDLTLVRQKLRMTPTERFEHMLGALRMQQELRRAGRKQLGGPSPPAGRAENASR